MKVALIQLAVTASKAKNLVSACEKITEAATAGARLICLPECFNSPYGTSYFKDYAESVPGQSTNALADSAKKNNVFVVGGSIPEECNDKLYNTCTIFNPNGELIAKYRKVHLFDIDVPGKIKFKESDSLTAGSSFTTFDVDNFKIGIGICYDIRFSELAQIYRKENCSLLLYPGAFNMTTGPAHWELLQRCRAIDNQVYIGGISPARDESASYVAWGHSSLIDPWGKVMCKAAEKEEILYADIDMNYVQEVRESIPLAKQRRNDLYHLKFNE